MKKLHRVSRGFSLVELIVILALLVVIAAIAAPQYMQWRKSLNYNEASRDMLSILRLAKNDALSANVQHRVELNPANSSYRLVKGNQAASSSSWATVIQDWTTFPSGVFMNCSTATGSPNCIVFNPNGTTNWGSVSVADAQSVRKFKIEVALSGRIQRK